MEVGTEVVGLASGIRAVTGGIGNKVRGCMRFGLPQSRGLEMKLVREPCKLEVICCIEVTDTGRGEE